MRDLLTGRRWRSLSHAVVARDGFRCQVPRDGRTCGAVATAADHIVPRSQGGSMWDPDNLRASCVDCNSRKGARERRDYTPRAAPATLTPLQAAIVGALDKAHAPYDIGRRTAVKTLAGGRYRSSDLDTACAYRRARGPTRHSAQGW